MATAKRETTVTTLLSSSLQVGSSPTQGGFPKVKITKAGNNGGQGEYKEASLEKWLEYKCNLSVDGKEGNIKPHKWTSVSIPKGRNGVKGEPTRALCQWCSYWICFLLNAKDALCKQKRYYTIKLD